MDYSRSIMRVHRFETRASDSDLLPAACLELWIKNPNGCRNRDAYVTVAGVYEDLKPGMNMHRYYLGRTWEGKVPSSFALGKSVDAVPDSAYQYRNDDDGDDGPSLALLPDFLKHSFLASLGQTLPRPTVTNRTPVQKFAPRRLLIS